MPNTPTYTGRTRSGSNAQNITLQDIKTLLDDLKTHLTCEIIKVNEKIDSLFKRLDKTESKVSVLEERCQSLDLQLKSMEESFYAAREEFLQEAEDRHRRRKFLIASGIQEHASGTLAERGQKDLETIIALAKQAGIDDFEPEEVIRIGKIQPSRPRLLKIKCKSQQTRNFVLKGARNLRSSEEFKNIFLNADQTLSQRTKSKLLRAELQNRREAGENVVIYRGRIVDKNFF